MVRLERENAAEQFGFIFPFKGLKPKSGVCSELKKGARVDFRFVLALRAIIAALVAVPVLGVLFGGLPPPVTFLYWTTFIVTAMMVARLATTLSVKTPNMSHVMAVATAPANKRLAANCRADDDVGHGKEAALPLAMRVRPTVVLSA